MDSQRLKEEGWYLWHHPMGHLSREEMDTLGYWPKAAQFRPMQEVVVVTPFINPKNSINDHFAYVMGFRPAFVGDETVYLVEVIGKDDPVVLHEHELRIGSREWRMTTESGDKAMGELYKHLKAEFEKGIEAITKKFEGIDDPRDSTGLIVQELASKFGWD